MRELVWLVFIYPFYALRLWLRDVKIYRRYPRLFAIQAYFYFYYFFFYPFFKHTYEKVKSKQPFNELVYGETPLSTLEQILGHIDLKFDDQFVDLGCGKGQLAFFVNMAYGIHCRGIDIIPTFIKIAARTARQHRLDEITFDCLEFKKTELSTATIVYVTATCLNETTLNELNTHFKAQLPDNAIVISVTHPIVNEGFIPIWKGVLPFNWGNCMVYISKKEAQNARPS